MAGTLPKACSQGMLPDLRSDNNVTSCVKDDKQIWNLLHQTSDQDCGSLLDSHERR